MTLDRERRSSLERARAEALVQREFGASPAPAKISSLPFGVVLQSGHHAHVVSMSDDLAVLGGVLVWLDRAAPETVDLIVDHHAGVHARRAASLAPEISVWAVTGDRLERAVAAEIPPPRPRPDDVAHLESLLTEHGLEVLVEDGTVRGELAGLEVARIVHGPDGPVVEAGVGRFDREAGALLFGDRSAAAAIEHVVTQVRPHRVPGAPPHAVNRIGRERWLRHEIAADPEPWGLADVEIIEPIPARSSLLELGPASLVARAGADRALVVCSVGADLGLIPAVVDLVEFHDPDLVWIALPDRDRLPHLERLASRVPRPTELRSISTPWGD